MTVIKVKVCKQISVCDMCVFIFTTREDLLLRGIQARWHGGVMLFSDNSILITAHGLLMLDKINDGYKGKGCLIIYFM